MKAACIEDAERTRLDQMLLFERKAKLNGFQTIAGLDEAGRGPLAGPVVAAACILQEPVFLPFLNDSKLLTPKKRKTLFDTISSHPSIIFGVGIVEPALIDELNIYEATKLAMQKAIEALSLQPDYLLIDGMPLSYKSIPFEKIIKGDRLSQSIAAASVIAKETRDLMMEDYHLKWPDYGFNQHKGYGTAKHLQAIQKIGPCSIHRRSFEPIKTIFLK